MTALSVYLVFMLLFLLISEQHLNLYLANVRYAYVESRYFDGAYFEKVIPSETISADSEGACVYEIITRDTPIGKRNYLHRVSIAVLKTFDNHQFAAISSSVELGSRVIYNDEQEHHDKEPVYVIDDEEDRDR